MKKGRRHKRQGCVTRSTTELPQRAWALLRARSRTSRPRPGNGSNLCLHLPAWLCEKATGELVDQGVFIFWRSPAELLPGEKSSDRRGFEPRGLQIHCCRNPDLHHPASGVPGSRTLRAVRPPVFKTGATKPIVACNPFLALEDTSSRARFAPTIPLRQHPPRRRTCSIEKRRRPAFAGR